MNILNNLPSSKIPTATQNKKGLMSSADKTKLDSIAASANNYVHPNDANTRHVTDVQIADWDNKASKEVVSVDEDGLMSKEDKVKLNSIAENANNYVHPDDEDTRHVTDAQITAWNAKASTDVATTTTNGLMSSADKTKLDGIAANANNYVHPNDASTRHVTDAQIAKWDTPVTKTSIGLGNVLNEAQVRRTEMGVANGVATLGANGTVPASQLPSYVDDVVEKATLSEFPTTGETGKIYVATNTNITYRWSGTGYVEISPSIALGETSSTAYAGDKGKAVADEVNKIKTGATVVPKATDAATVSGLTVQTAVPAGAKFTDTTYSPATTSANGLMASADKTKLDGLFNYTHPNDSNTRHVTDLQIAAWDAKASTATVTASANGLMSSADKTKLDGIAANANNYVHPNDASTRHVTDAQITTWNSKLGKGVVGYTGTALALNSTSYTVSTGNIYTSVKNGSVTLANSNKALVRVYFYNASTSDNTVIGYGDFFLSATDGQSNIVPLYNGTALDFVQVTCNATVANTLTFDVKSITQNYLSRVKFTIDLFPN